MNINEQTQSEALKALYIHNFCGGDSFSNQLFRLIAKADTGNRLLLSVGFPHHVAAWTQWFNSDDPDAFLAAAREGKTLP